MPQQKRSGSTQGKRSSSTSKSTARKKSSSGGGSRASQSRAGSSRGTTSGSGSGSSGSGARTQQHRDEAATANLSALRETLAEGVVITGERLQEAMDDAVRRGKVTADDAQDIVARLVNSGRQQTRDLLDEIEQLLTRGRGTIEGTARTAADRARKAPGTDRVLKEVDRARRVAGLGPSFPITDYENLTAAQVTDRLDELSHAELRKVRDHEKRNANRKTVLAAVEKQLA
jgi:polyhydroxyalkanoate synthesis regulator phasin